MRVHRRIPKMVGGRKGKQSPFINESDHPYLQLSSSCWFQWGVAHHGILLQSQPPHPWVFLRQYRAFKHSKHGGRNMIATTKRAHRIQEKRPAECHPHQNSPKQSSLSCYGSLREDHLRTAPLSQSPAQLLPKPAIQAVSGGGERTCHQEKFAVLNGP